MLTAGQRPAQPSPLVLPRMRACAYKCACEYECEYEWARARAHQHDTLGALGVGRLRALQGQELLCGC